MISVQHMLGNIKFSVSIETIASPEEVVDVISDWRNLPTYWHGMRDISQGSGNMLIVKFAFPGEGKMSYICDMNAQCCTENYHSGPFSGFKRIEITQFGEGSLITVRWEISLSARFVLFRKFMLSHFRQGTESALTRIVAEAESKLQSPEQKAPVI